MAKQLELTLSLADAATLRQEHARMEAYAREMYDENAQLRAQVRKLKQDNASWARSYKTLKAERDAIAQARLSDTQHPLHAECVRLHREIDDLRAKLFQRVWQELENLRSPSRQGTGWKDQDLKRLLGLAHPDKWSQGQPATELAHELSVAINQLREGVQA